MESTESSDPGLVSKFFQVVSKFETNPTTEGLSVINIHVSRKKRQIMESTDTRRFSVGTAAKFLQVFGVKEPKQHNHKMVALKTTTGKSYQDPDKSRQQENLQDWIQDLEFRMKTVCLVPPKMVATMPAPPASAASVISSSATPTLRPAPDSVVPAVGASCTSDPGDNPKPTPATSQDEQNRCPMTRQSTSRSCPDGASGIRKPSIRSVGRSKTTSYTSVRCGRSRSQEKQIESVVAAVTNAKYLEELQLEQTKELISSLHERLTERKVKETELRPSRSAALPHFSVVKRKKPSHLKRKKTSTASEPPPTVLHRDHMTDETESNPTRSKSALSRTLLKSSTISHRLSARSRCELYLERYWEPIKPWIDESET